MSKPKGETIMQLHKAKVPPLPASVEQKRLVQAEVNRRLFTAIEKEIARKKGLSIRKVMEWGLRAYLLNSNPEEAAKLGITAEQEE